MPEIYLFASTLSKQFHRYASWMLCPDALYIDAMSINWENQFAYLFPAFNIWPVVSKISLQSTKALAIAPMWLTQVMVQKIVRTSSEAANDYQKQISATPYSKSKTSSSLETQTSCSDVHSRSAQISTIQKKTINVSNAAWRDGTK